MTLPELPLFLTSFFDFLDDPIWRAWPFNAGYGDHLLPSLARLAFVTVIMGAILLFLRFLFGPGGPLRDKELDREAEEERRQERAELDAMLENGEITELEYKIRMKGLKD